MTGQAPELLPCPFCGAPANLRRFAVSKDEHTKISNMVSHIQCVNDEGCKVTVDIQHVNEAVAIEAWNTRPPSERPVARVREAIKNALRTFCESLGARVVTASSDGVERIYYSGLSLDALSVAATMAALTAERPEAAVAITDAMVNAAAREMWNDRDARHGGSWESRGIDEVCVLQTKATARAALTAALAIQHEEPGRESELAEVCAEAYQVVGTLLSDTGQFETERGTKILDNLSEGRMVHRDVLPWPSIEKDAP